MIVCFRLGALLKGYSTIIRDAQREAKRYKQDCKDFHFNKIMHQILYRKIDNVTLRKDVRSTLRQMQENRCHLLILSNLPDQRHAARFMQKIRSLAPECAPILGKGTENVIVSGHSLEIFKAYTLARHRVTQILLAKNGGVHHATVLFVGSEGADIPNIKEASAFLESSHRNLVVIGGIHAKQDLPIRSLGESIFTIPTDLPEGITPIKYLENRIYYDDAFRVPVSRDVNTLVSAGVNTSCANKCPRCACIKRHEPLYPAQH